MALVDKQLKQDPDDPLFRLYLLKTPKSVGLRLEDVRIELESILAEATRRKEEQSVRIARQQLEDLKISPPPAEPFGDLPPEDEFDDGPFPDFGGMPSEPVNTLDSFINLFANIPEPVLKQMRNQRPPGMSLADFDMLVGMARARRESPDAGFPPRISPSHPSHPAETNPPPESDQRELF
jgi:hypothetical protein